MRKEKIIVEPGEQPPGKMTVEGVHFTYEGESRNKAEGITHYVYRSEAGWLISFTDRQFAVGIETDPNRKSDWWACEDKTRSDAAKAKAAKSVPGVITSPAWSTRPRKTKKKQEAQQMNKKGVYKRRKAKSEDLFL